VNGVLFEFKNIIGGLDRVEMRFRESRTQSENVFLKIDTHGISKADVLARIGRTLRNRDYTGGTKGTLVFYVAQTRKVYFMKIRDLK